MKTHRVELPDGNLLKIEGGDAEQVAKFLTNHLTRNMPLQTTAEGDEPPLLMPVINFSKESAHVLEQGGAEESAMEMPVMNFA